MVAHGTKKGVTVELLSDSAFVWSFVASFTLFSWFYGTLTLVWFTLSLAGEHSGAFDSSRASQDLVET